MAGNARFHDKLHRKNHHTLPSADYPDSAIDPIASHEEPFQGDFVINGSLSTNGAIQFYSADLAGNMYCEDFYARGTTFTNFISGDSTETIISDGALTGYGERTMTMDFRNGIYAKTPIFTITNDLSVGGNLYGKSVTYENLNVTGNSVINGNTTIGGDVLINGNASINDINFSSGIISSVNNNISLYSKSINTGTTLISTSDGFIEPLQVINDYPIGTTNIIASFFGVAPTPVCLILTDSVYSYVDFYAEGDIRALKDVYISGNLYTPTISSILSALDTLYSTVCSNSADWACVNNAVVRSINWDSTFNTVSTNSANWDSTYNTVNINSANWDSTYTSVSTNSSNWDSAYATVSSSPNWDSVYNTVNSLSPNWDSVYNQSGTNDETYNTVNSFSSNWDSVYNTVNSFSSNWDLVYNTISINESTYNTVNTNSANWDSTYNTINTNSANWDSTYNTFKTNSADWDLTQSTVSTNSANWDSTYSTVRNGSANWDSTYTSVSTNSAEWNTAYSSLYTVDENNTTPISSWINTYNTVKTYSGDWKNTYDSVEAGSPAWWGVYDFVNASSGTWDSTYTNVSINSANWNSTYNTVSTNSATWDLTYSTVSTNSANWNSTYNTVSTNSANWDSSYTTVSTNSAFWNSTYSTVSTNSANWNSSYTTVSTNSANWNSSYNTVKSTSATWLSGSMTQDYSVNNLSANTLKINQTIQVSVSSLTRITSAALTTNSPAYWFINPNGTASVDFNLPATNGNNIGLIFYFKNTYGGGGNSALYINDSTGTLVLALQKVGQTPNYAQFIWDGSIWQTVYSA